MRKFTVLSLSYLQEKKERRKKLEAQIAELRAPECTSKASSIWDEIDLLEGSSAHRGAAMRSLMFKSGLTGPGHI